MDRQAPARHGGAARPDGRVEATRRDQQPRICHSDQRNHEGTFALKVDEYKQVKALARENLRDHMTDIELILTMLGEATTTKLHRDRDSVGMPKLKKDAKDGGAVAGRTRKDIEQQSGKPVISPDNFKQLAVKKASKVKKIKGSEG